MSLQHIKMIRIGESIMQKKDIKMLSKINKQLLQFRFFFLFFSPQIYAADYIGFSSSILLSYIHKKTPGNFTLLLLSFL